MSAADRRDQRAADKEVDPDRLLEGEDPTTPHPEDARHWMQTYRELLAFKKRMLSVAGEAAKHPWKESAAREVASTDLVTLKAEQARFKRRLEFWKGRLDELPPKGQRRR